MSSPLLGLPTAELDPDRRTDIAYIQLRELVGRQRRGFGEGQPQAGPEAEAEGWGAQETSTRATPVPHRGVRWGQGCGWGSQSLTNCDFLNSVFLVCFCFGPRPFPFLEATSCSVAQA